MVIMDFIMMIINVEFVDEYDDEINLSYEDIIGIRVGID